MGTGESNGRENGSRKAAHVVCERCGNARQDVCSYPGVMIVMAGKKTGDTISLCRDCYRRVRS